MQKYIKKTKLLSITCSTKTPFVMNKFVVVGFFFFLAFFGVFYFGLVFLLFANLVDVYSFYVFDIPTPFCMLRYFCG